MYSKRTPQCMDIRANLAQVQIFKIGIELVKFLTG